jgi:hypothetical protein
VRQPDFTIGMLSIAWLGGTLMMFATGISAVLTQSVTLYQTALVAGMVGAVSMASILFHLRTR